MRSRVPLLLAAALAVLLAAAPSGALPADPVRYDARAAADPGLTATAGSARDGEAAPVTVVLTDAAGEPAPGRELLLERWDGTAWVELVRAATDDAGAVASELVLDRDPARNRVRATWAGAVGDPVPADQVEVRAALQRRASVVRLGGPDRLPDGQRAELVVTRTTGEGEPVPSGAVVQRRTPDGWRTVARVDLGADGRAVVRTRPREDVRYRATAPRLPWVEADRSPVLAVDNVPPGTPVAYPAAAPEPRVRLPRAARATTAGADARVLRIPDSVWRDMVGVSWRPGCPVGRAGLRLVRANHYGFDGYRYRGEVVMAAWAAPRTAAALTELHRRELPLRSLRRVDRFGYSSRVRGGDDHRSMAADNSSGFNCRDVVNNPGTRSPHSYGGSFDLNPWENPYRSRTGLVPNSWWMPRSHPRIAWRSSTHAVVEVMRDHGFRWTYGLGDAHHFDAVRSGRVVAQDGREVAPSTARRLGGEG